MFAAGAAAGLVGGAWLIQNAGWQVAYASVFPFALVLPALAARWLPDTHLGTGGVMDLPGAVLLGGALASLLVGLTYAKSLSFAQRLENSRVVVIAVAVVLAGWLADHFLIKGLGHEINSLNVTLLLLTFLLYGSVKKFSKAVENFYARPPSGNPLLDDLLRSLQPAGLDPPANPDAGLVEDD
jgi:hypothetical protein